MPMGLSKRSYMLAAIFALTLITYSLGHCQLYKAYILHQPTSISDSFIWALHQYGIWCILTPLAFRSYTLCWPKGKALVAATFIGSFLTAIAYSTLLDKVFAPELTLATSIVTFLSTQLIVATLVAFLWLFLLRPKPSLKPATIDTQETAPLETPPLQTLQTAAAPASTTTPAASAPEDTNQPENQQTSTEKPFTLTVSTGSREQDIPVNNIECISASGNYMEVYDSDSSYILRSTMKELEQLLRPYGFVRVHRSHLIQKPFLKQLTDDGTAILHSGRKVPVSRRYSLKFS